MDSKLTWRNQCDEVKKKGHALISQLCSTMKSNRSNLNIKMRIYKTIVRPVITYGFSVWEHAAKSHLQKIQIVQNRFLRIIAQAPRYVRNTQLLRDLAIETIPSWSKKNATKLFEAAETSTNPLLREAVNYTVEPGPRRHKRPRLVTS